ncbi:UMP kinase [Candidatus Woesearchaeota archaeon]|nr:UMP kinase [Candidatus Woesearchaeota archaeon]
MQKTIILSLGGSLIVPDGIDIGFLRQFKKTIEKYAKKNYRFAIYCGGGRLARNMQDAASKIAKLSNQDLDWIGTYATRLNALLLWYIFKNDVSGSIVADPTQKINFKKNVIIAAGWKPGWSTDYDAVLLAKNLRIKEIVNMSNVDYVCDKDPKKHRDAKRIGNIKWAEFVKLVSRKWKAGMNVPFDPVAAKEAQKSGMKVSIIGRDLRNLENLLEGKKFRGTVIR